MYENNMKGGDNMANDHLSTRDEILFMLKTNGSLTVSEISKELGITEMAVRRHLNTLERDELIRSTLVRQAMGRPTNLYSLTEKAEDQFPKTYRDLAKDLLDAIAESEGIEKIEVLFDKREQRLRKRYLEKMAGRTSLDEKVKALVDIQNDKGYMVDCEKVEDGFLIKEYNCPIAEIARDYNHACEGEKKLFKNVLGTEVESVQCMARGDHSCIYKIKQKVNS